MPAIKIHHTATDTKSAWDGPGEVGKAPAEEATLRYMHAWIDSAGDPNAKGSYKFPHHVSGTDTPANIHGVDNAMARLSQSDIPEADQAGVKAHLEAHRKDAGLEDTIRPNHPIRCFAGNAEPHQSFWNWRLRNEAGNPDPELEFDGVISEYSWWGDEITPKMFKDQLYANGKGGPVKVKINSPGGEVIAATMIKSMLQDYPGQVTGHIIGLAASAATMVCMGCDTLQMDESALMMIHDPGMGFFLDYLNIDQMSALLDQLKTCKEAILNGYQTKTGLGATKISNMMSAETWMSAHTAKDLGFIDAIVTGGAKVGASQNREVITNLLPHYRHVPAGLLTSQPVDGLDPATERLRAEVKFLAKRKD